MFSIIIVLRQGITELYDWRNRKVTASVIVRFTDAVMIYLNNIAVYTKNVPTNAKIA